MMKRWASALLTVGSVGLTTFPALAQGIAVNGKCYAGSCSPPTLAAGSTAFLPYGFNVTLSNGDIFQILGTANLASGNNGGEYLNFPFLLTYLGTTAGPQPSQGEQIILDGYAAFQGFNGTITENLTTAGYFSSTIAPASDFAQILIVNGNRSGLIGFFEAPGPFSGSGSVSAPAGSQINTDIQSVADFHPGSSVGSMIAVGSFPSIPVAAILPGSRSVQVGATATVFGTMINTGASTANECQIALPSGTNSSLSMIYQATDPKTNRLSGTADTPVTIAPGASQSFVLAFQATGAISETPLTPLFVCTDSVPAQTTSGVDTVNLLFSQFPVPDIIALALTQTGDGTVHLDITGLGFFVVATANLGITSPITATVTPSPNVAPLLNGLAICQTDPATSNCLAPPTSSSVTLTINNGAEPTFGIFASSAAPAPFLPALNRVYVNFTDSGGTLHGSTSVAVASASQ
jgi:hypothetical protein